MSEIIFKIFGATLIVSSSLYFSMLKITSVKRRIAELSAFRDMIGFIHDNIEHFTMPLPEIFSEYRNSYLENSGLIERIRKYGIAESLSDYSFSISNDERDILIGFADKLGNGYRNEELNLCKYTDGKLAAAEDRMLSELKNVQKLYITIPLMLALSVILILI